MRSSPHTGAAVHRRPGSAATVLVFLLALLTAAGTPTVPRHPDAEMAAGFAAAARRRSGHLGAVAAGDGALGSLGAARALRASVRRDGLPPDQRRRLDGLIAGASPAARGYVAEAFAAGHPVAEVAAFAATIAGREPAWLRTRLRPVDPMEPGAVGFGGTRIRQYDGTSCGPATILVARALLDPVYALHLTTDGRAGIGAEPDDGFRDRLRAEQQKEQNQADVLWPQFAGTPPWGMSRQLNRDRAGLGARYRWMPTTPALKARTGAVLRQAMSAANQGYPVPVLIGDVIPRHYVLLLRHDARGASFYEPNVGEVVIVPAADLDRQDFSRLGYPYVAGVILPAGPGR